MTDIFYITNPNSRRITDSEALAHLFSPSVAQSVRRFHQSLPKYEPTPLVSLNHLAHNLQVSNIWIKDESFRFGLNAFKVLGASYAVAYILAQKINTDEHKLTFDLIQSHNDKEIRAITLAAATDGNHGRAVAWAAQQLGCKAVVYMPTGSSLIRFNAIKAHGAEAHIIEGNYDDAVHFAAKQAQKNGWVLVQDTSWEGYEEIPIRIMQGYLTIIDEALEQLEGDTPTHIFVQCGVGSLAAASQAYVLELFGVDRPTFVVVEPLQAACFYKSMAEYDGDPKKVSGDLNTIMAGLACGEPSVLAWKILRQHADVFVACPDYVAMKGMRILAHPLPGDDRIVSGESGAVTLGLLAHILGQPTSHRITEVLNLNQNSKVLLISTEGDTEPETYKKIIGSV